MSIKTEKNLYQKYDDLFDEQDKQYDQNNHDRYKKKKDRPRIERVERVERVESNEQRTEQRRKQKSSFAGGLVSLVIFGGLINFLFVDNTTYKAWISPTIIFVIVIFVISKALKNK